MGRFIEAWKIAHCGTCGAGGSASNDDPAAGVGDLKYSKAELETARETMREWIWNCNLRDEGEAETTESKEVQAAFIAISLINNEINKG